MVISIVGFSSNIMSVKQDSALSENNKICIENDGPLFSKS